MKIKATIEIEYESNDINPKELKQKIHAAAMSYRHRLTTVMGFGARQVEAKQITEPVVSSQKISVVDADEDIHIRWTANDVIDRAAYRGITLSRDQAKEILSTMKRRHDCEVGINWDVIDVHTDDLLNNQ